MTAQSRQRVPHLGRACRWASERRRSHGSGHAGRAHRRWEAGYSAARAAPLVSGAVDGIWSPHGQPSWFGGVSCVCRKWLFLEWRNKHGTGGIVRSNAGGAGDNGAAGAGGVSDHGGGAGGGRVTMSKVGLASVVVFLLFACCQGGSATKVADGGIDAAAGAGITGAGGAQAGLGGTLSQTGGSMAVGGRGGGVGGEGTGAGGKASGGAGGAGNGGAEAGGFRGQSTGGAGAGGNAATGGAGGWSSDGTGGTAAGGAGGRTNGGVLSSCSPAPRCAPGELPVRVQVPALGQSQCTCVSNPCGSTFPTCDCANALCATYFARCSSYAPDSGFLVCIQPG
jgi:hypothetical protein